MLRAAEQPAARGMSRDNPSFKINFRVRSLKVYQIPKNSGQIFLLCHSRGPVVIIGLDPRTHGPGSSTPLRHGFGGQASPRTTVGELEQRKRKQRNDLNHSQELPSWRATKLRGHPVK